MMHLCTTATAVFAPVSGYLQKGLCLASPFKWYPGQMPHLLHPKYATAGKGERECARMGVSVHAHILGILHPTPAHFVPSWLPAP